MHSMKWKGSFQRYIKNSLLFYRIEWINQPDMLVARKDHACAMVMLGDTKVNLLVNGNALTSKIYILQVLFSVKGHLGERRSRRRRAIT